MIKSDSTNYNSSISSTESDCFSENNKSIDTVTQLFSNLLKNSETSTNQLCKSSCSAPLSNENNSSQSMSQQCNAEENHTSDLNSKSQIHGSFQRSKEACDNSNQNTNSCDQRRLSSCLATSSETVIVEKNKDFCTPFNSKIPVLHARSDPTEFYDSDSKTPTGRKLINPGSLKRLCSNSKIPVRNARKNYSDKSPSEFFRMNGPNSGNCKQTQSKKTTDKSYSGKYTHVKSKLAAYINRPSKMDTKYSTSNTRSNYKAPREYKRNREDYAYAQNSASSSNYLTIRRESKTSLDTCSGDYKMSLPDFNCLDCYKSDDLSKNYQKAREHLEQAAEHCRIKLENRKIIQEHERIIAKHQQIVLEHEQKANEHELNAIAYMLNRVT